MSIEINFEFAEPNNYIELNKLEFLEKRSFRLENNATKNSAKYYLQNNFLATKIGITLDSTMLVTQEKLLNIPFPPVSLLLFKSYGKNIKPQKILVTKESGLTNTLINFCIESYEKAEIWLTPIYEINHLTKQKTTILAFLKTAFLDSYQTRDNELNFCQLNLIEFLQTQNEKRLENISLEKSK